MLGGIYMLGIVIKISNTVVLLKIMYLFKSNIRCMYVL